MDLATPKTQQQLGGQAMSPGASLRSFSQELLGSHRLTPPTVSFSSRSATRTETPQSHASSEAHSLLLSRESELSLLRQQMAQLTADFKYNLKLLSDRDAELERVEQALATSRETALAKDAALADTRRALFERESAIRDRDTRLAALEARHREVSDQASKRVTDERAARDDEIQRCKEDMEAAVTAAKEESTALAADYETKLAVRLAAEAELTGATQRLREENEALRSDLHRAEARCADNELTCKRSATQLEGAMAALRQVEAQYQSLAEETQRADTVRTDRILALEAEIESLRVAKATLSKQSQTAITAAAQQAQQAQIYLAEARAAQQRALTAATDAESSAERLRKEVIELSSRCTTLDTDLRRVQDDLAVARGELEKEKGARAGLEKVLEAATQGQDAARREVDVAKEEGERWVRRFEKAEDKVGELTRALEDEKTRVSLVEQHCEMLKEQIRQERSSHAQALSSLQQQMQVKEQEHWTEMEALQAELVAVHERLQSAVDTQEQEEQQEEEEAAKVAAEQQQQQVADQAGEWKEQELQRREAELRALEEQIKQRRAALHEQPPAPSVASPASTLASLYTQQQHQLQTAPAVVDGSQKAKMVADELGLENAKLRQQLATMKLSFLDDSPPEGGLLAGPVSTSRLVGAAVGGGGTKRPAPIPTTGTNAWQGQRLTEFVGLQPQPASVPFTLGAHGPFSEGSSGASEEEEGDLEAGVGGGRHQGGPRDEALDNARRQVMLAKEYLKSIAALGGELSGEEEASD